VISETADLEMSSSPVASEGVLDVSCRKAPGVHLGDKAIEHVGVAVQKAHEARVVGFLGVTHLGDPDLDRTFGAADAPGLVAIPRSALVGPPALVAAVAAAAQIVSLLGLEQLLNDEPRDGVHEG
jgi:hypothetical protein